MLNILTQIIIYFIVDMWSVGCIFAELLGRKILFQAQSPIQQVSIHSWLMVCSIPY